MFQLYLEGTSVLEIVQRFDKLGWRNKQWTTQDGKLYGGSPLRRCHIYKQLGNILYTGRVKVGNEIFLGEHEAIVGQRTFELAQARLKENAWKSGNPHRMKMDALLRGMIYCSCCGSGMYSTYSANKQRRYRYTSAIVHSRRSKVTAPPEQYPRHRLRKQLSRAFGGLEYTRTGLRRRRFWCEITTQR
jgi:site-specific DNA recombinase